MKKTNRRQFIKNTSAVASGAFLSPLIFPSCSNWKGANDRLNIGHIGVGSRGWAETKDYFLPLDETRSVAVCDVETNRIKKAAEIINKYYKEEKGENGFNCDAYEHYEELLERKDIDAVHIVTGDSWHLPIAIKAMRAGKHVYLAKPLGLNYPLMKLLDEEQKKTGLVFHYGTQQRSFDHINAGINIIRDGSLGKIDRLEVWAPGGSGEQVFETEGELVPDGFNYDKWLGPAPFKPYSKERVSTLGTWFTYDYAIGFIAGWGAHPLDVAVMGAKDEMNGAYTLNGSGSLWQENGLYDTVNSWNTELKYENGLSMHFVSADKAGEVVSKYRKYDEENGTTFFGENGWISLGRSTARASDPGWNKTLNDYPKYDNGGIKGENNMHGANFARVIKGEMAEFNPLDEAIMSDCISHMGDIAIRLGQEVSWDPDKGQITNVPEANTLFNREMRAPYNLDS